MIFNILITINSTEYEVANEESFYRPGTLQIFANGTSQNVKYFVTSNGFHLSCNLFWNIVSIQQGL